jgi:LPXTG-site transpeptidase (sortase) family protein
VSDSGSTPRTRGGRRWAVPTAALLALAVGTVLVVTAALQLSTGSPAARADGAGASSGVARSLPPYESAPAVTIRETDGAPAAPSRGRAAEQQERAGGPDDEQRLRDPATPGVPRTVVIPKLGVRAPVVGVTAPGGTLTPPADPQTLGWWSAGARPGAVRGSALVTGHTVSSGGGALDDLEQLSAGDAVGVRTAHGALEYVVRQVSIYHKATLARQAEALFSQTVPGRLVLITCEDWDGERYLSNVVVIAEPAPR